MVKYDGVMLLPKNSAAYMRLEIEIFNAKLPIFYPIFSSRGQVDDIIDRFGQEVLPYWEELCEKS